MKHRSIPLDILCIGLVVAVKARSWFCTPVSADSLKACGAAEATWCGGDPACIVESCSSGAVRVVASSHCRAPGLLLLLLLLSVLLQLLLLLSVVLMHRGARTVLGLIAG